MNDTGTVGLTATVTQWTQSTIEIQYELENNSSLELIVFDVDDLLNSVMSDGIARIFKGKLETPDIDFATQPLIGGRNLSPDQTVSGTGTISLPLQFEYVTPVLEPAFPDAVEFCVGYGNADLILPTTRPDGQYTLNTDVDLQTLACVLLMRP